MCERTRLSVFVILLLLVGFAESACFLNKYDRWKQEQIDQEIEKSVDLVNLAATCDKVASVQKFELLSRDISTHGGPAVYCYYRSHIPFAEASKNIADLMNREGWHSIENSSMNYSFAFQRDDFRVIVQNGGMRDADYGITCEKKAESAH